jgi:hypothetical protein
MYPRLRRTLRKMLTMLFICERRKFLTCLGLSICGSLKCPSIPDNRFLPTKHDGNSHLSANTPWERRLNVTKTVPRRLKVRKYIISYIYHHQHKSNSAHGINISPAVLREVCSHVLCSTFLNMFWTVACSSPVYPSICSLLLPVFQKSTRISGHRGPPCCSQYCSRLLSFLYLCCHFSGVW